VFKDAEIIDFAVLYAGWSVARRFDPELDAFLLAGRHAPGPSPGRVHRAA
jgi:hypothetical protein